MLSKCSLLIADYENTGCEQAESSDHEQSDNEIPIRHMSSLGDQPSCYFIRTVLNLGSRAKGDQIATIEHGEAIADTSGAMYVVGNNNQRSLVLGFHAQH